MRRTFLLLMGLVLCLGAATPATQPAISVEQLITRLGDPDPAVRERATKDLTKLGTPARSALLTASKSEDPEVAARASAILRQLPWWVAGDPPQVRDILRAHGRRPPEDRASTVHELLNLPGNVGFPAVLRLLENETDTELRWAIVSIVRNQWTRVEADNQSEIGKRRDACRKLSTDREDAPLLCLAAAAWMEQEPARAAALYRRAISAADMTASVDFGELEAGFDFVYGELMTAKRYADVADLLRRKAMRSDQRQICGVPEPVAMLFMLHAKYGPVPGLAGDRRTFWQYQASAPVLYAASASLIKSGHALAAGAVDRVAFGISALDPDSQVTLGRFLAGYGMGRQAARELERFLAHAPQPQSVEEKLDIANAQMMLAKVYARIASWGPAGRALDAALVMLNTIPDISVTYNDNRGESSVKRGEEAMKHHTADMHGYYLQDAIERDDQAEIARRIKALQDLPLENPEIVQEIVFWLQNNGRRDEADYYFHPVEKRLMDDLKKDPTANNKNSLAWFRARSHRKLDEALKLSKEAVAMEPDNAAYIDTLAEIHFQQGMVEEAIAIERRAMKADPGAPELESQMRRYLKGRKTN